MIEKYQHSPCDNGDGVKYERMYGDEGHMDYINEVKRTLMLIYQCFNFVHDRCSSERKKNITSMFISYRSR